MSKIRYRLFKKTEVRLVMIGLDAAGKTSILFQMKLGELIQSIPTIGFNAETVEFKNYKLNIWDVASTDKIRIMWKHYYANAKGVIFVVDSSDITRIEVAREEFHRMLASEDLKDAVFLILANKQDIALMDVNEVIKRMDLASIGDRPWHCEGTSAVTGQGLTESMNWLVSKLEEKKAK